MPKLHTYVTPLMPAVVGEVAKNPKTRPKGCTGVFAHYEGPNKEVCTVEYTFSIPDHFSAQAALAMQATVKGEFLRLIGLIYTAHPACLLPLIEYLVRTKAEGYTVSIDALYKKEELFKLISKYLVDHVKAVKDTYDLIHKDCTADHCYTEDLENEFKV